MGKTIGTVLSLTDRFSPILGNVGKNINNFNGKIGGVNKNINNMSNNLGNGFKKMNNAAGSAVKGIGMKVAGLAAGLGLGMFAKDSIELASNLSEVQNVVDTTFGKSSEQINSFAKTAITQYGLSELQAKQFAGTIGSLGAGMGISGQNLDDFSMKLTGLSADFASFYNLKPEEAFDKIKAGIVGSSEPLLSLGIDMRDAALETYVATNKMKKSWKQMDGAEKTQVRFNYLMEKGKLATGDFVKTQDGFANQTRILKNNIQSAGASIASIFLPNLNKVLQTFNGFMSSNNIQWVTNKVKEMADGFGKWATPKLMEFKDFVTTHLLPKFTDIGASISKIVQDHGPALEGAFDAILGAGKSLVELGLWAVHGALKWFDENKDMVDSALGFIKGSFEALGKFIEGDFKGAFDKAGEAVSNLIDTLSDLTLQMASSDNPVMHMIGELVDMPVGLAEAIGKGDAGRFFGTPEDNLQKKRNERAKSRETNKNYNEMQQHYKDKYKNTKEIKGTGVALPEFAKGTSYAPKGTALVGEKGPELINLRGGEDITTSDKTRSILGGKQIVVNNYLTIQGNMIGNEDFAQYLSGYLADELTLAMGNR